jgi:5'-nucleotidase
MIVDRPLILVTNDDGIRSDGLQAAVDALAPLGDVLVVAPDRQWSGAGRSMPSTVTGELTEVACSTSEGQAIPAYAVDATPAQCVIHGMLELVDRAPALVVSGINFGENVSTEITISGTIGAALEASVFDVPALAVSLEMSQENHYREQSTGDSNYAASKAFTYQFARMILGTALPFDVDVLSINVPQDATPETDWQFSFLSHKRYFVPLPPAREEGRGRLGYQVMSDPTNAEVGSDVWCLHVAHKISVTPLSTDLTSRVDLGLLEERLCAQEEV